MLKLNLLKLNGQMTKTLLVDKISHMLKLELTKLMVLILGVAQEK